MCPIVPSGGWVDGPITFETESVWARRARVQRYVALRFRASAGDLVAAVFRAPTRNVVTHAEVCATNQRIRVSDRNS